MNNWFSGAQAVEGLLRKRLRDAGAAMTVHLCLSKISSHLQADRFDHGGRYTLVVHEGIPDSFQDDAAAAMETSGHASIDPKAVMAAYTEGKPTETRVILAHLELAEWDANLARLKARREEPADQLIVVHTCTCYEGQKQRALAPLVEQKVIDAVVVTGECCGTVEMLELLSGLDNAWKCRSFSTV